MSRTDQIPVLLCVGGHDPAGGAGIQADAEAARAAGVHATSVVSCLTTQDTCGVRHLWPQPPQQVEEQCRVILADSRVGAIKTGLLGSSRILRALTTVMAEHPSLPLIVDPVLTSGGGEPVADAALLNQMRKNLIGRCTMVTPNLPEARTLSGGADPDSCAVRLLETGCAWVLITGTHDDSPDVVNRLYGRDGHRQEWRWPRLTHQYHGSGCTLASAVAARLVAGMETVAAVAEAQAYTWESLARARRTGRCQLTPDRLFALAPAENARK